MDLGATICTPRKPKCLLCPLSGHCRGRVTGEPERFPVKAPKKAKPLRVGTAFWIERGGAVWLVQRAARGMLGGMRALPDDNWSARGDGTGQPPLPADWRDAGSVHHGFTHFDLELRVLRAETADTPPGDGEWWPVASLDQAGLPTLFAKASARALDQSAAQHEPQDRDHQHDEAEVAPVV